jgi:hypothetical protein
MIRFVIDVNNKRTAVLMSNYGSLNVDLDDIRVVRSVRHDVDSAYASHNPTGFQLQVKVLGITYGLHYDSYADLAADHAALVKKICEPIVAMPGSDITQWVTTDDRSHIHIHATETKVPVLGSMQYVTSIINAHTINACCYANESDGLASLTLLEGGVSHRH